MFEIGLTKDAPGAKWCKVWEIEEELYVWEIEEELYEYEKEIFPKYRDKFPFKLWICFRCLPKEYGRKSMRRYYGQDMLWVYYMAIDEEIMRPFAEGKYNPLSEEEQRLIMGRLFYDYLAETFEKYKNKLAGIKDYGDAFLEDTKGWLFRQNERNGFFT